MVTYYTHGNGSAAKKAAATMTHAELTNAVCKVRDMCHELMAQNLRLRKANTELREELRGFVLECVQKESTIVNRLRDECVMKLRELSEATTA